MRIAVVDDNQYDLKKIILEIQKFEKSNHVKFYMQCFHRAEILCMELEENRVFDAYFLDIEMADMNGLSLAKKIREKKDDAYIVFVTSHIQYAIDGYDIKAYQYILKDVLESKLPLTLQLLYTDFREKQDNYFIIQTNSRYEKILYRHIYYIYKKGKNTVFVTKYGKTQLRKALQEVYDELQKEEFIYTDRSHIVNIRYITKFQKQEIVMTNSDILSVSRYHMSSVKAKIGRYWRDGI